MKKYRQRDRKAVPGKDVYNWGLIKQWHFFFIGTFVDEEDAEVVVVQRKWSKGNAGSPLCRIPRALMIVVGRGGCNSGNLSSFESVSKERVCTGCKRNSTSYLFHTSARWRWRRRHQPREDHHRSDRYILHSVSLQRGFVDLSFFLPPPDADPSPLDVCDASLIRSLIASVLQLGGTTNTMMLLHFIRCDMKIDCDYKVGPRGDE